MNRLLLGLLASTALLYSPVRAAEIDPVLPAETESIVFFNIRSMLESEVVKKYALGQVKQMLESGEAQKWVKDLGLDPLKDIERVTIGSWGKQDDMNAVFVVRGNFDLEKIFAAAKNAAQNMGDKISIVDEGKYKLIKISPDNSPRPVYATFADETTIVAGTDKQLAIKAREAAEKKGAKPAIKKELAELLLKQDEKATMYLCGTTDGKIEQLPPGLDQLPGLNPEKLQKQLEQVRNVAMTLRLTDEIGVEVTVGMKDSEAADDFGGTVSQLLGTVKGFLPFVTGQRPNLKPLVDELNNTLKSKVKEKDVTMMLKLSADSIGKAIGGGD